MANNKDHLTKVWEFIRNYKGRDSAIPGDVAAHRCNMTYEEFRNCIRRLIREKQMPIGSCDRGYFIIQTEDEAQDVCRSLKNRALKIMKRMAIIQKVTMKEVVKQLELEI